MPYQMTNGLLVVEMEDLGQDPASGWVYETDEAGYKGGGFYRWAGPSRLAPKSAGDGALSYTFEVKEAGTYFLSLRAQRDAEAKSDTSNDVWFRLDGKAFGPNGGTQPWTKVFFTGANDVWQWGTTFDYQNHTKAPASFYLPVGVHTIEFSGRSAGFHIDRFHLKKGSVSKDANAPASTFAADDNDSPALTAGGIEDRTATPGKLFTLDLKPLFSDADGDLLTYFVVSYPGGTLPKWLKVQDGVLSGWVPKTLVDPIEISVTATDKHGVSASDMFALTFAAGGLVPGYAPNQDLDGDGVVNSTDSDIDGDGVANASDPFAYDAANGRVLADGEEILLSFSTDGTPYQNGLTGLMLSAKAAIVEDSGKGSVGGGALRIQTGNGDAGGALNTQTDAYHLGIRRGDDFTVETKVKNPFGTTAPVNFQQLGVVVDLGQDDFVKLAFGAAGGKALELVHESAGAVASKLVGSLPAGLTFAQIADVVLELQVGVDALGQATAKGKAMLLDAAGAVLGVITTNAIALAGTLEAAIADATAAVGVGVIATSFNGKPSFEAAYDYLKVSGVSGPATIGGAVLTANAAAPGQGNIAASTYGAGTMKITNSGDKDILSVTIDLAPAHLARGGGFILFDPAGTAGDAVAKGLDINSFGNTGAVEPADPFNRSDPDLYAPFSGAIADGFRQMKLQFDPNVAGGFNPGETVAFSVDIDPSTIKGASGSGDAGSVSGLELTGAIVTVTYADGSTQSGTIFADGSLSGGMAVIGAPPAAAPTLTVGGKSGAVGVTADLATVQVTGIAGASVTVAILTGGLGNGVPAETPFDANTVTGVSYQTVQLDGSGTGSFTVDLSGGKPIYIAGTVAGGTTAVSSALILARTDGPLPPPAEIIDFSDATLTSYGLEDKNGTATVQDEGDTLRIAGNSWKKTALGYEVTADTVLTFEFKVGVGGEIQGIGVDVDDSFSNLNGALYELFGNQTNNRDFVDLRSLYASADTDGDGWAEYAIRLGDRFTGNAAYLTFINDHDLGAQNGESWFRDVRLFEDSSPA